MTASASPAPASVAIAATAALAASFGQPASTPLTRVALTYIEPRFKLYLRFGEPVRRTRAHAPARPLAALRGVPAGRHVVPNPLAG